MVGKTLGHYEILEPLGKGGMGEVYRARDTKLDRDVAIKVLPEDLATDADRLARFEREAKLLAALNHANIGAIHGLEESDDVRFLVLELIEGETLEQRLAKGAIPVPKALDIARQIAEALEAAHDEGIIHRDVKPANVLLTAKGGVKVLDFGIAKNTMLDANAAATAQATNLTTDGTLMGTPPYMSPEQMRGEEADKRADIWSFGCVLYETLTGKRAFDRETVADTLAAIIERNPDYDTLPPDVPPSIRQLVRRCLEKDQRERLRDIGDARIEIKQALAMPPANDTYRKTYEPPGMGAEAVRVLRQEERRRQKEIEGYKRGGLITAAAGIGFGTFLYFTESLSSLYLVGLVPLMIGLVLILYGFVLAPRSSTGSRS
jgi:serine/threonine protein kinase